MKTLLLTGAVLAALISASQAADLAAVEPVDVWSGYFAGIQGGYSWTDGDFTTLEDGALDGEGSFESEGGIVGLYYGRNWQSGNWVYGLEGSASYVDGIDFFQDDAGGLPGDNDLLDVDVEFLGTSRIKVGYAFDNILLYAAGGLATGYFQVSMDDIDIGGGPFDDDGFAFGWTIGAGIETKFAENWSARIEYLYVNFDDDFSITDGGIEYETNLDLDTSIVRGGIAYHF